MPETQNRPNHHSNDSIPLASVVSPFDPIAEYTLLNQTGPKVGSGRKTIFSAPRRFDTATLFIVTFVYSILLGALLLIGVDKMVVLAGFVFFSFIGICQAVLFGGNEPRGASICGGAIFGFGLGILLGWIKFVIQSEGVEYLVGYSIFGTVMGIPAGYLGGALVGGVFLVTHFFREAITRKNLQQINAE